MIRPETLTLVHYCHPDCEPLRNIMRLPREEAFALAARMAQSHPDTTAFGRFADFDNYYRLRVEQDRFLHREFLRKGGEPEEEHPLSFVLEGSGYLSEWFGGGKELRLPLAAVDPRHISFTVGDSGSTYQREGRAELLTLGELRERLARFDGGFADFMASTGRGYIEAQLWSDRYVRELRG